MKNFKAYLSFCNILICLCKGIAFDCGFDYFFGFLFYEIFKNIRQKNQKEQQEKQKINLFYKY